MRFLILITAFLAACSTAHVMNKQVQQFNAAQEEKFQPTRARFTELKGGVTNLEFGVWAGTPGETAANPEYRRKVLDRLESHCGFDESSLKEVRVVKHEPPIWYEVWVFNNPASKRHDKTSGFSIVFEFNPSANTTTTSFYGSCQ
ncbi:MAG TPA: hypothetical protein VIM85_08705 [Pseudomonadales bacterium]